MFGTCIGIRSGPVSLSARSYSSRTSCQWCQKFSRIVPCRWATSYSWPFAPVLVHSSFIYAPHRSFSGLFGLQALDFATVGALALQFEAKRAFRKGEAKRLCLGGRLRQALHRALWTAKPLISWLQGIWRPSCHSFCPTAGAMRPL